MYHRSGEVSPHTLGDLLAVAGTADLSPGPGGSRITPVGRVTVRYGVTGEGRIVVLEPSCQLVEHADPPIPGWRYHIPLTLNPHCWVFHGGQWQQLDVGTIYQMDPTQPHGAVNWGTTRRLHLMVDTDGDVSRTT